MTRIVTMVVMVLSLAVNLFLGRVWYDLSKLNSKLADDIQRISAARLADDSSADFRASLAAQATSGRRRGEMNWTRWSAILMPCLWMSFCVVCTACAPAKQVVYLKPPAQLLADCRQPDTRISKDVLAEATRTDLTETQKLRRAVLTLSKS